MHIDRHDSTRVLRPGPFRRGPRVLAAAALLAIAVTGPALGFAPGGPAAVESPALVPPRAADLEAVLGKAAAARETASPTLMERIGERLRRIPLRPVMIGETPRTPDDPEPGAGVTVFIRF